MYFRCLLTQSLPITLVVLIGSNFPVAYASQDVTIPTTTYEFHIPSQVLSRALAEFSIVANQQLLFSREIVINKVSSALAGHYSAEWALRKMLQGTGLDYKLTPSNVFLIKVKENTGVIQNAAALDTDTGTDDKRRRTIEEIIITAAYREQDAQKVATTLQVFGGAKLEQSGADGYEDYFVTVPGASFRDNGSGAKRVSLRGVSNISATDFAAVTSVSTVGVYLNDIPVQGASLVPDFVLYDLKRIEVLKGPQGTLYGDGVMGGAVKLIYNPAATGLIEKKIGIQVSATEQGAANYRTGGVINVPLLEERLALRVVGSYLDDNGFVDNLVTGHDNVNDRENISLRALLYAELSEQFSAEVMLYRDEEKLDEFTQVTEGLGDLKLRSLEDRLAEYRTDIGALTFRWHKPFAELTSITSYHRRLRNQIDRFPNLVQGFFGDLNPGALASPYSLEESQVSVTQEFRLVSPGDKRLNWVAGLFYRDRSRDSDFFNFVAAEDLPLINAGLRAEGSDELPGDGRFIAQVIEDGLEQWAVYTEFEYKLTEEISLTAGLRWFQESVDNVTQPTGFSRLEFATEPLFKASTKDSGVIPKIRLSYQLSDSHLLYLLAAKGFRSSTINTNVTVGLGEPAADADTLWSFELGAKTGWYDSRLILNASLFYIIWSDIQLILTDFSPVFGLDLGFLSNAGGAEIRGFEIDMSLAATDHLSFGLSAGYTDTEMVSVSADALKGAGLPNSPNWTLGAYGRYVVQLADAGELTAGLSLHYVDKQATQVITSTFSDGAFVDSYAIGNFRISMRTNGNWEFGLFVDNIWNERAELGRGLAGFGTLLDSQRLTINRPRTIGLAIRRHLI